MNLVNMHAQLLLTRAWKKDRIGPTRLFLLSNAAYNVETFMWFVTMLVPHNCIVAGSSNAKTVIRLDPPYLKTEMPELTCGSACVGIKDYSMAYFEHIAEFKVLYR